MNQNDPHDNPEKPLQDFGNWLRGWAILGWVEDWVKAYPLWAAAHFLNVMVAIFLIVGGGIPILTVVIFLCIIFVQIYTEPIKAIQPEFDKKTREAVEEARSQQRNKWMIFAYSFMLISLLLTFYPFINSLSEAELKKYLATLREKPIAIFIACSLDDKAENLRCAAKNEKTPSPEADQQTQVPIPEGVGHAWAINIGGNIERCTAEQDSTYGRAVACEVRDGLLVPLYFIVMALMGGSISLTRRLPELQKQAGSEHIATIRQPKLSQYEFREYLIFQMVQFISAPFLAILAYYLIEPSNTTNAVVLAFTAGFASETILLMVRSVANKISPNSDGAFQYGAIAGIIRFCGDDKKIPDTLEVFLTEQPQQAHAVTDADGFYTLNNVPVGEHSISVKYINRHEILQKDIVKVVQAQAVSKKNITIPVQGSEVLQQQNAPPGPDEQH
ncbi:MAG: carboxypeptidase-like regulatory domain-containing protein [Nitrosomonas sp.]|nr:MAG: carboxypeptidase-like regulatory domain-containing protein [Nitrosomonas sp.]